MSDVLDVVLDSLRIRTTLFAMAQLAGTWGVTFPQRETGSGTAYFHAVQGGPCWLRQTGQKGLALGDGDVVLLPHGSAHEVVSHRDGRGLFAFDAATWRPNAVTPALPAQDQRSGPTTTLVCGAVDVPGPHTHPLLGLLPAVVTFASGDEASAGLALTLSLLRQETRAPTPGTSTVLARLGDVLLVQLLRTWLSRQGPAGGGWLAALRDPGLAAALQAIHERPADPWTVETLAARAQLSRSRFAEKFTAEVGMAPLAYLTQWRMTCASRLLGDGRTVHQTARAVGYTSEPAFSRAFHRTYGTSPSTIRAAHHRERDAAAG